MSSHSRCSRFLLFIVWDENELNSCQEVKFTFWINCYLKKKGTSPLSFIADANCWFSWTLCQDPHLNRFFQQCQKRELDLSLPPTSNFLNCLKVRAKSTISPEVSCTVTETKPGPRLLSTAGFSSLFSYLFPSSSTSSSSAAASFPSLGSSQYGENPSDHPISASAFQPAVQGPDSKWQWWGHDCHHQVGSGTTTSTTTGFTSGCGGLVDVRSAQWE